MLSGRHALDAGAQFPPDGTTAGMGVEEQVGRASSWLRRIAPELVTYVAAASISAAGAVWALRLWRADLHVPLWYWGDAVAVSAHVKTTLSQGWYESQPLLGWPYGQHFHDFPTSDDLSLVVMKVMGAVLHDWALTLNVYFFLGFPLAALTATYFLRRVGVNRTMAVVGAVLYALAPYHFQRNEAHLFLAMYWVVPPALLVCVRAFRGEPLWSRHGERRPGLLGSFDIRAVSTGLAMVLVSAEAAYYGVFTLTLLAVAGVVAFSNGRSIRRFCGAVMAGVVAAVTLALLMLPDSLYERAHGTDVGALSRDAPQAEIYALKITSLLLPVPGHRFGPFASIRNTYDTTYPLPSETPTLGAVAAVGLVLCLVVVVIHLGRRSFSAWSDARRWSMTITLGALVLVALLVSTVGGVGSLVSFLTPNIRGWNRMSIFISLLCFAGVGLAVDHVIGRLAARHGRPIALVCVASVGVGLVGLGTLDQVAPTMRPDVDATATAFRNDATWVRQVEDEFGADAAVFQLPYMSFPESPALNGAYDTDPLKPFLHSDTLRWSGGGIKGRARSDWPATVAALPTPDAADAIASAGFTAVVLDTVALGPDTGGVQSAWRALAGPPVVVSPDSRYLVFDLRPLLASLTSQDGQQEVAEAGEVTVTPTMLYPEHDTTVASDGSQTVWSGPHGVDAVVDNGASEPRRATITMTVIAAPGTVTILAPWGRWSAEPGSSVTLDVEVPPGRTELTIGDGSPVTISAPVVTLNETAKSVLTAS